MHMALYTLNTFLILVSRGHHITNMRFLAKVSWNIILCIITDFSPNLIMVKVGTPQSYQLTINKCLSFDPGIVSSNTRDFAAKVTYPHLNFSIPVSVLEPLLSRFAQTQDPAVFQELDSAEDEVRRVWRLQIPQSKL